MSDCAIAIANSVEIVYANLKLKAPRHYWCLFHFLKVFVAQAKIHLQSSSRSYQVFLHNFIRLCQSPASIHSVLAAMAAGQPAVCQLLEATMGSQALLLGLSLLYIELSYACLSCNWAETDTTGLIMCFLDHAPGHLHKQLCMYICWSLAPGPQESVSPQATPPHWQHDSHFHQPDWTWLPLSSHSSTRWLCEADN